MLRWALLFLVIALIAGALGIWPVEALGRQIAWILFVIVLGCTLIVLWSSRRWVYYSGTK